MLFISFFVKEYGGTTRAVMLGNGPFGLYDAGSCAFEAAALVLSF